MTDRAGDLDRDERIRRLQERRGASARARPTARPTDAATPAAAPKAVIIRKQPRRRHPAAPTRWLLAGLSVASFFTIAGTVAMANQANVAGTQPASSTATPAATNTAGQSTTTTSATPRATTNATTPAAHTTTRAS